MTISKIFYSTKLYSIPSGAKTFSRKLILNNVSSLVAYNTVLAIDKYKDYIPYCTDSKILKRSTTNFLPEQGSLRVEFQKYKIEFTCDVECKKNKDSSECTAHINEEHEESSRLFDYLCTKWKVRPINNNGKEELQDVQKSGIFKGLEVGKKTNSLFNKNKNVNGCEVDLELSFKFKSKLLHSISVLFGEATMTIIMNGFKKRMLQLNALELKETLQNCNDTKNNKLK